jgi:hypothetical protein
MTPHDTIKTALLPCPFCGGEAWLFTHDSAYTREFSVRCGEQGCVEIGDEYESDAVKAWNTRAALSPADPPEPGEVERVALVRDAIADPGVLVGYRLADESLSSWQARAAIAALRPDPELEALREAVAELWHRCTGADKPLHEYLNMTWDEYVAWANPVRPHAKGGDRG